MDRAIYVAEAEAELQQRGITAQKESALPPGRAMLFGHFALEVTPDELTVAREVITGPMHLDYLQPKE